MAMICAWPRALAPLRIVALQAEGKRVMTAREFLAGHPIAAGELLTAAP